MSSPFGNVSDRLPDRINSSTIKLPDHFVSKIYNVMCLLLWFPLPCQHIVHYAPTLALI